MTTTPSALTLHCVEAPRDTLTVVPIRDDLVRFEAEDPDQEVMVCLTNADAQRLHAHLGEILRAKPVTPAPIRPAAEYPMGTVIKIGDLAITRIEGAYRWSDRGRGAIACDHDVMDMLLKTDGVTVTEPCRPLILPAGLQAQGRFDANDTLEVGASDGYANLSRDEVRQLRDHLSEVLGDSATEEARCQYCDHLAIGHNPDGSCGYTTKTATRLPDQACMCVGITL